jgi:hypothetical protein
MISLAMAAVVLVREVKIRLKANVIDDFCFLEAIARAQDQQKQ